jgi:RNA polymerase sigma factor (sigma-70 family)
MCENDSQCIEKCLDSQPEAFRHLVARYQSALVPFLVGKLGSIEQAEEAAQETFVRAYFNLAKLKKPESFFPWLLGIAIRIAKEQHRTEKRRKEIARLLKEKRPSPELSDSYGLESAVAELPEPHRQIVLLRYYGGLTCSEVAQKLEMPLGTVTKYLSRAYQMLRESLHEEGGSKGSEVQL